MVTNEGLQWWLQKRVPAVAKAGGKAMSGGCKPVGEGRSGWQGSPPPPKGEGVTNALAALPQGSLYSHNQRCASSPPPPPESPVVPILEDVLCSLAPTVRWSNVITTATRATVAQRL